MKHKLFLDTDVVIDFLTNRSPYSEEAGKLFELSEEDKLTIYLSATSINNIYYIVRRHIGHNKTLDAISILMEMVKVIDTRKDEILKALISGFSDFEDSIQYASALNIRGLHAIITRNVKDYRKSSINVMTPSEYVNNKAI